MIVSFEFDFFLKKFKFPYGKPNSSLTFNNLRDVFGASSGNLLFFTNSADELARKGFDKAQIVETLVSGRDSLRLMFFISLRLDSLPFIKSTFKFMPGLSDSIGPDNQTPQKYRIFALKQRGAFVRHRETEEPFSYYFVVSESDGGELSAYYVVKNLNTDRTETNNRKFSNIKECSEYLAYTKGYFGEFKVDVLHFSEFLEKQDANKLMADWLKE